MTESTDSNIDVIYWDCRVVLEWKPWTQCTWKHGDL